jgi:plasmid maintenance system antidote protein VapI
MSDSHCLFCLTHNGCHCEPAATVTTDPTLPPVGTVLDHSTPGPDKATVIQVRGLAPSPQGDAPYVAPGGLRGAWLAVGRMLTSWLANSGLTQVGVAYVLGVSQAAVSQWCAGVNRPSPHRARAIQEAGGPPAYLWNTLAEDLAQGRMTAGLRELIAKRHEKK